MKYRDRDNNKLHNNINGVIVQQACCQCHLPRFSALHLAGAIELPPLHHTYFVTVNVYAPLPAYEYTTTRYVPLPAA